MDAKKLGLVVVWALFAVACKGGSNLSVNAKGTGAASAVDGGFSASADGGSTSADGGSAQTGLLDLGQGIEVARARIVVASLRLEGQPADGGTPPSAGGASTEPTKGLVLPNTGHADHGDDGTGDDGEHEDSEVKLGPFLIDLSGAQIDGKLVQLLDTNVPPGTYHEIRFVVAPAGGVDAGVPAEIAAMNGSSVIIDGTVTEPLADGGSSAAPFSFASSLRAAQKQEVEMDVTVSSTTHNVTLTIDPTGWFKGPNGSRLDPTVAASHAAIEDNFKDSIRATGDEGGGDDHGGGSDDDGGHGHH